MSGLDFRGTSRKATDGGVMSSSARPWEAGQEDGRACVSSLLAGRGRRLSNKNTLMLQVFAVRPVLFCYRW